VQLLTLAGVEVEGVETSGCAVKNVVAAQILESAQHPNADRLSVCKVDDGTASPRQIVCGAKNYKVGDKVPLALPGADFGGGFVIKVGKLRGVESQGMMCSAKELGLAEDADGLLILPADTKLGTPIGELFPSDTVLDLEITPNRPDLLSVIGIAREVATLTGKPWKNPAVTSHQHPPTVGSATLQVADAELCPLYTARKITGVKVGQSPEWLRAKLTAVGLRPINNVVDITNFVMLETGQPLHVFDAAKLDGALNVRLAREGEDFLALDGKTYKLAPTHLVIADAQKAVAIGGVMGGEESGVTEATTDIWLESALFQPQSIRRTSRALGLSSDSSYRFERGVDPAGVAVASQRAAELIAEVAGGTIHHIEFGGKLHAAGGERTVPLRSSRVATLLGVEVSDERIAHILSGFGLWKNGGGWQVPSFRPDLTREVDLIEEIARVIGMDVIPQKTQARFLGASETDRAYDREMALRRSLVAAGLHEARSITLVPAEPLGIGCTKTAPDSLQRVKNPMIDDQVVLRPNLLHGLLTALRDNLRAGAKSVRLFEVGRVFRAAEGNDPGHGGEFQHEAIVLSGPVSELDWRTPEGRNADLFDLKGILAAALGDGVTFDKDDNAAVALSLVVKANGSPVGFAGQLWPADARALDTDAPVLFAEIDLGALAKAAPAAGVAKKYREIPRFPSVTRDIAMVAAPGVTHEAVMAVFAAANEPLLAGVELFDVFADPAGVKLPAGHRSLAYSLTYRANDRTLTAEEVNAAHQRVKEGLKARLAVTLRE
jgi:phenylalanyl-tRNA synthetase beta chain